MNALTITLNPAIDATYVVEGYRHGGANRVLRRHAMPGGKGNNVARVLAILGEEVVATGFAGGVNGFQVVEGLQHAGIETYFTQLERGETRTCHTILETDTGIATEVLERGPTLTRDDRDRFLRSIPDPLRWAHVAIVSGSAPPGATPGFLARLARSLRRRHSWTDRKEPRPLVVDSSGVALHALLAGKPDVLKPNEDEILQLMGTTATLPRQVRFLQDDLIPSRLAPGARVILSQGSEGAVLVTQDSVLRARPPKINVVNTVGCGDALLAGFVRAWLGGADDRDALRDGVATGTAAALEEVAGFVQPRSVKRLKSQVEVSSGMS